MNPEQTFAELFNMAQELFGMREEDLDPDAGILELGLDSLMIIRLGQEIERRWGVSLEAAWFFLDLPSLKTLAAKISVEASPGAGPHAENAGKPSPSPVPATSAAPPPLPEHRPTSTSAAGMQLVAAQLQSMHELFARQLEAFAQGALSVNPAAMADTPVADAPAVKEAAAIAQIAQAARPRRGFILKPSALTQEQARFVAELTAAHLARTRLSREKSRSNPVLADWKSTLSYRPELKEAAYPIVADRMAGGRFTDLDGNEYIDIAVGMGVHFLGHNPPYVEEAIRRRLERGFGLGPQCDLTALAAEGIGKLTGMQRVCFCNTGSEAVMFALRLARAKSGKRRVALFSGAYHGIFDGVLAVEEGREVVPSSPGSPPGMIEDVILLDYGSETALQRLEAEADALAAVLVEPVQSRRPGLQPQNFLRRLRRLTREKGICLIFDEMVNGFRIAPGGSQEYFGIRADIALYGKIIGGGLPVGVIAGRKEYLDLIDGGFLGQEDQLSSEETIVFGGTFCRHPLSMEAVVAVTDHLARHGRALCENATALTAALADELNLWFQDNEVPLRLAHYGAQFVFEGYGPYSAFAQPVELSLFYLLLMARGVYTWERRTCGLGVEHTPQDTAHIAAAVRESVLALRAGGFPFRLKSGAPAGFLPMTPIQENLYATFLRARGQDAYHLPLAFRLTGEVDAEQLEIALGEIIRRHEALRTAFVQIDGRPLQKIVGEPRFFLETTALGEKSVEDEIGHFIRPFDLATPPLLRARLARQTDGSCLFLLDALHIAADGASLGLILEELNALMQGRALASPVPFREVLSGAADAQTADCLWWAEKLKNLPRPEWPFDFPARAGQPEGGQEWITIGPETLAEAKAACKDYGITLNMFLNGVHALMLAVLTRSRTILSGMADGGRFGEAAERAVGMFVNTVPQLFHVDPDASLRAFFADIRRACAEALQHRHAPYKAIVDALGFSPVATMLSYERADHRRPEWPGVTATPLAAHGQGAMYDFSIDIVEMAGTLHCNLTYSHAFRRETALSFGETFTWLTREAAQKREARVGELQIIPPAQLDRLRKEWAGTARPLAPGRGVLDDVLACAARLPGKTALILDHAPCHESVTYAELLARSKALAQRLIDRGVQPGQVVGVLLPRRPAYVIAMLGVWRAGAVLMPLAADLPDARLAFMLEDSRAAALLVDAATRSRAAALPKLCLDLCMDIDASASEPERDGRQETGRRPAPHDLAYILYTSGTTGQPKGVMVEHRSLYNICRWFIRHYAIGPEERGTAFAPFIFDPSLWEILPILMQGGTLHILHEDIRHDLPGLHAYLRRHRITTSYFLSQVAELIDGSQLPDLRLLTSGADVLHIARPRGAYRHENSYGPTEFTITSHAFELDGTFPVPVGKPVDNTQSLILDEAGRLMPDGFPGEMCLAGAQIARGYLSRPDLTEAAFVPNPAASLAPAGDTDYGRMYRTGDLFRRLPDGNYLFMGRLDGQVKIRGFRVETAEISSHAMRHPQVRQAVAVALDDDDGQKFLCLYVIPTEPADEEARESLERELHAALGKALPPYMLPARYLFLSDMPHRANGKVDIAALPRPEKRSDDSIEAALPRGAAEEALASVWREHLHVTNVRREDNFFELGGDSIKALMLTASIRRFGFGLEARDIFGTPVLRELAERLSPLAIPAATARPPEPARPPAGHPLSAAEEAALRSRYGAQLSHVVDPTPLQLGMLFQQRLGKDAEMYVEQTLLRIDGKLDAHALRQRFFALIERHESLRSLLVESIETVEKELERPRLLVLAAGAIPDDAFAFEDWRGRPADDARLREEAARERAAVGDPARPPLARLRLYRLADDEYRLLLTVHHVFFDGWSSGIFFDELFASELPAEPATPFRAYAEYLAAQDARPARDWWRRYLEGVEERTLIPGLAESAAPREDARLPFSLTPELRQSLHALAKKTRATINLVLQAAWALVLSRANRRDDALFGAVASVRPRQLAGMERIVGLCVNTLPVYVRFTPDQSFSRLLGKMRDQALEAAEHAWLPLPDIQAQTALRSALFAHFFVTDFFEMENYPAYRNRDDLRIAVAEGFSRTGFDFALSWETGAAGLDGVFIYNRAALPDWQAESLRDAYLTALEAVASAPDSPLSSHALLSPTARQRLLRATHPAHDAPLDATEDVIRLFRGEAARHADDTALVCGGERLSYAVLDRKSDALAAKLAALRHDGADDSGERPAIAAILLERGTGFALACLAVLKAGAAFLPLDAETPEERLAFILEDARPFALLSQSSLAARAIRGLPCLDVYDDATPSTELPCALPEIDLESPAYVIYTSGTTGTPKGVVISRRALAGQARWSRRQYRIGPDSRITHFAAHAFDVSLWETLPCLTGGGQLHVLTDELRHNLEKLHAYVVAQGIGDLWLPPRLASLYLERYPAGGLRSLAVGGDVFQPDEVRIREENRSLTLFNNYGPTECTITATSHRFHPGEPVTIGKPVDDTPCYVLDAFGHLQPLGFPGELHIGGPQVAIGYLNRAELSEEKFLRDPFSEKKNARMYRTGDRCRWLPDGKLDFSGRLDTQLKIRGYRLEAGEVESALLRHPLLNECVAMARPGRDGTPRLLAWGVAAPGAQITERDLLDEAARWLPAYMLPERLILVDALPLTANGKIDLGALPEPRIEAPTAASPDDETPEARLMTRLLCEALDLDRESIHPESDFFDLGGDSIKAMLLVAALERHGYPLSLKDVFRARTARALAALLRAASATPPAPVAAPAHGAVEDSGPPPIPEADERCLRKRYAKDGVERILPLTPMQEGMLFDMRHAEDGGDEAALYFIETRTDIQGALDPEALENRIHELISRHEALRIVIAEDGVSKPWQVILRHKAGDFRLVDLAHLAPEAQKERIAAACAASRRRPPALDGDPLLRTLLFRLGPADFHMVLQWHHIVLDGWSLSILLQELLVAELPLVPAPGFSHHIERLQRQDRERHLDWWRAALADAGGAVHIALSGEAKTNGPDESNEPRLLYSLRLDRYVHDRLVRFARAQGVTRNAVLMTVWGLLLSRYSDREDFVFATLSSGRSGEAETSMVGPCIGLLPMRLTCPHAASFGELAATMQQRLLEALEHDGCSGAKIRHLAGADFGRLLFVMENQPELQYRDGLIVKPHEGFGLNSAVELALECLEEVLEKAERLRLNFHYDPRRYTADEIERLSEHFRILLENALAAPDSPSGRLAMLGPAETLRLLEHCNATRQDWPETAFTDLFLQAAARFPDAIALRLGDAALTYAKLRERALNIAARLVEAGLPPGAPVGILLPRSADYVIAELGVMLAGSAFVPLDADAPARRLSLMLENCRAFGVITDDAQSAHPLLGGEAPPAAFFMERLALPLSERAALPAPAPEALAYILYTSGSTGVPKGAAIAQKSLANLCRWFIAENRTGVGDVFSLYAPFIFDASIYEAFPALACGAAVAVVPPEIRTETVELADFFRREQVSVAFLPPMVGKPLFAAHAFAHLKVVTLAGEAPGALVKMPFKLMNCYGPTEFSVCATFWPVTEDARTPPIGKPVANTRCYVLDSHRRLMPFGAAGELYLSGIQRAQGYVGLPEKTAESFVPNPFAGNAGRSDENHALMYRSGDLCRWLPDGNLAFIGRQDRQIKVRGQRLEPGEIERALGTHPAVTEAAAVLVERGAARLLMACAVLAPQTSVTEEALMAWLAECLPAWMLPANVRVLPALPLTGNGKIDREALAAQIAADAADAACPSPVAAAGPRTGAAALLEDVWKAVLGLEAGRPVDDEVSFFALGGDSIKAMQMATRLRAQGYRITTRQIFKLQSLGRLLPELKSLEAAPVEAGRAQTEAVPVAAVGDASSALQIPAAAYSEIEAFYAASKKSVERILPATPMQEALLAEHRLHPDQPHYLEQSGFTLVGRLDADALSARLAALVARHRSLRAVFFTPRGFGAPCQVTLSEMTPALVRRDLSGLSTKAQERHLLQAMLRARKQGFDLEQGPLLALELYTLAEDRHVLQTMFHHAILDGWSVNLILRDLFEDALPPALPRADFADYAKWLATADRRAAAAWWRDYLADALPPALPRAQAAAASPRPQDRPHIFDPALTRGLRELASHAGVTMNSLLQSAWGLLLARLCDQEEAVFGVVLSGRAAPVAEVEEIVGMLAQTVPARIRCPDDQSVIGLLKTTQDNALAQEEHAVLPLVDILKNTSCGVSLLQHLFVFENLPDPVPATPLRLLPRAGFNQTPYALALVVDYQAAEENLSVRLQYDENAIPAAFARDLPARLEVVLRVMRRAPESALGEIGILLEGEAEILLRAGLAAPVPVPIVGRNVLDAFRQSAARAPLAVALTDHRRAWNYGELDAASDALAVRLDAAGIGRGDVVALCMERSASHIPALIGILKTGAAWLAMDTEWPRERRSFLLADSGAAALIVDAPAQDFADFSGPRLSAPDCFAALADFSNDSASDPARDFAKFSSPQPEDIACLIYTSGSTGEPKGVRISHAALSNFSRWHRDFYGVTDRDRAGHIFPFTFDASFWGIFPLLAAGGGIYILTGEERINPLRMREAFDRQGITLANIPALLMEAFCRLPAPAALRLLTSGGDVQPAGMHPTPYRVFNEYGPTEATVMCACHFVEGKEGVEGEGGAPIGRAIAGAWCMVLDRKGRLLPFGAAGELHIAGPGLAQGYWRRDRETAESFVANAYAARLPETEGDVYRRRYRSGDLCRMRPDGTLDFLGRRDTQFGVRGHRVEAAELERHLSALPGARAAVAALDAERGRLVAYVVPEEPLLHASQTAVSATFGAWREALSTALPAYMRPDAFVLLEALPLTSNGKVDRGALPAPRFTQEASPGSSGPLGAEGGVGRATELALSELWRTVLEVPAVGLDDDFFALGGDSLKAVRLAAAAESLLGLRISVTDFMRAHTLRDMLAQRERNEAPAQRLILLRPGTRGAGSAALVLVPSLGGSLLCYKPLLDALPADLPVHALIPPDPEDTGESPPESLEAMMAPYVAPLAAAFPEGDVALLGLCMAGLDAWEIARQLKERGIGIRTVVSLNTRSRLLVDETGKPLTGEALAATLAEVPAEAVDIGLATLGRYEGHEDGAKFVEKSPALLAYIRAQLLAWGGYRPQPAPIAMLALRPEDAALDDYLPFETRPLGWSEVALGGSRDLYVSGSHFGMLRAPHASEIATVLLSVLRPLAPGETIPLTPIQRWFFDLPVRREHFFQSVTLTMEKARPAARYQKALRALAERHDMLRAFFRPDPEGQTVLQSLAQDVDAGALFGLQFCEARHLEPARQNIAANLQLFRPPLAWCVVGEEETGTGRTQRVLFMLHHLIVDSVSWRILLQDFATALDALDAGAAIALPVSPGREGGFAAWAARLAGYAAGPAMASERAFWCNLPVIAPLVEADDRFGRLKRDLESVGATLDADTCRRAARQGRALHQAGLDAVLLAAFLEALRDTLGRDACTVLQERHGREELFPEISPLGLVGWFTTLYPLPLTAGEDFAGTLAAVRRRLESVPNNGLGYGLLRYLAGSSDGTADGIAEAPADLTFNFLGEIRFGASSARMPFTLENLGSSQDVGDDFPQETPLALTAHIQEGALHLTLDWHPAEFERPVMTALLERMIQVLEELSL